MAIGLNLWNAHRSAEVLFQTLQKEAVERKWIDLRPQAAACTLTIDQRYLQLLIL